LGADLASWWPLETWRANPAERRGEGLWRKLLKMEAIRVDGAVNSVYLVTVCD